MVDNHRSEHFARSLAAYPSWLNVLVGAWQIASPWMWGYADVPAAVWNAVLIGAAIVIASLWSALGRGVWTGWWNVAFGIWLLVSPLVLRYQPIAPQATVNDRVAGLLVITLALLAWLLRYGWTYSARQLPTE